MEVKNPNGGELWLANQTFNVRWTSQNLNALGVTYAIDLLRAGNPVPVLNIAAAAPGTGLFAWTIPNTLAAANDYLIRITQSGSGLEDVSDVPFSIAQQVSVYYVNDAAVEAVIQPRPSVTMSIMDSVQARPKLQYKRCSQRTISALAIASWSMRATTYSALIL